MKYYIAEGTTPMGPYEIEQLYELSLKPDTLVWTAGMTDWVSASTVEELSGLFQPVPPPLAPPEPPVYEVPSATPPPAPITEPGEAQLPPSKPFDWLWPSIAVTLCCCSPFAIIGIYYASECNNYWKRGDIDQSYHAAHIAKLWALGGLFFTVFCNVIYALFRHFTSAL